MPEPNPNPGPHDRHVSLGAILSKEHCALWAAKYELIRQLDDQSWHRTNALQIVARGLIISLMRPTE